MRIGVVIHGPEVIDSGFAAEIIEIFSSMGEVKAVLGGAMGAAAVQDNCLGEIIEVRPRLMISSALLELDKSCDLLVLLNQGKSRASSIAFGNMVFRKIASDLVHPFVQSEPGLLISWTQVDEDVVSGLIERYGPERLSATDALFEATAQNDIRKVHGVVPGERIWINGTVIGRATSSEVEVSMRDGRPAFKGIEVKAHGLEKLKMSDLETAVIRSGMVRRTMPWARKGAIAVGSKILLIDHAAEDSLFRSEDVRIAVTIGDDTTRISSSLLYRIGVPVIGITDGDEDQICSEKLAMPGSAIILLPSGNDDGVGAKIKRSIFNGKDEIISDVDLGTLLDKVIELIDCPILEIKMIN